MMTPPASGTVVASASTCGDCSNALSPSRSHCTTAPAMKTLPSSAYSRVAVDCAAVVETGRCCEICMSAPVCISMKQPVP